MPHFIARALGRKAVGHAQNQGWLDVRLGFALLKDRRVPAVTKLAALGLGLAMTLALEALEVPLEGVFAALVPLLGIALDIVVDGVELLALPFLFGAIFITHMAPKGTVAIVRDER